VFGRRVAAALAAKGVTAPEPAVIDAAEGIVQARARDGTLRLLTSDEFNPIELHGETTPSQVQTLLANLVRDGATGIRLPLCPSCRTRGVVKRVCQRCAPEGMPTFTCDDCGKTVTTVGRVDGRRVCLNCFPKRLRLCVSCGQEKKIAVNILHGPHCFACHNRILRNPAPCPGCDEKRILAFLGADDLPCCAGCAGQPPRYACRRCGSEEHNYGRLCGKCVLSDRCDDILTGPDGEFLPPMQALRDYLLAQPRPAQIIKWLHMGPSTDLPRDIASARAPIESILDAPRPSKPLIYLRTLLLDSGALPRDAAATRQLMAWATHTIGGASGLPPVCLTDF